MLLQLISQRFYLKLSNETFTDIYSTVMAGHPLRQQLNSLT